MRVLVHVERLTVGGHDLGGEQIVDREAVLPQEEADATAERDAPDADGAGVPEPRASPCAAAAVVNSPAVRPVPAHAVRLFDIHVHAFIADRSSTMPSDTQ